MSMLRMAVAARHHRHRSAPVPALLEECRKRRLPYILGIETSCDDTAAAVLDRDGNVLSNVISSQWELNAKWKGNQVHAVSSGGILRRIMIV
jgi:hypothetical protein